MQTWTTPASPPSLSPPTSPRIAPKKDIGKRMVVLGAVRHNSGSMTNFTSSQSAPSVLWKPSLSNSADSSKGTSKEGSAIMDRLPSSNNGSTVGLSPLASPRGTTKDATEKGKLLHDLRTKLVWSIAFAAMPAFADVCLLQKEQAAQASKDMRAMWSLLQSAADRAQFQQTLNEMLQVRAIVHCCVRCASWA